MQTRWQQCFELGGLGYVKVVEFFGLDVHDAETLSWRRSNGRRFRGCSIIGRKAEPSIASADDLHCDSKMED
jgi:hypothetical protein